MPWQEEDKGDSRSQSAPALSVVVPSFNAEKYLSVQLGALLAQNPPFEFEIVIVDNRSVDGTPSIAADFVERDDRVRLVSAHYAQGVNVARNAGCRAARADFIVLADADDEARAGWLLAMHSALQEFDCVGGTNMPFGGLAETDRAGLWLSLDPPI